MNSQYQELHFKPKINSVAQKLTILEGNLLQKRGFSNPKMALWQAIHSYEFMSLAANAKKGP